MERNKQTKEQIIYIWVFMAIESCWGARAPYHSGAYVQPQRMTPGERVSCVDHCNVDYFPANVLTNTIISRQPKVLDRTGSVTGYEWYIRGDRVRWKDL